MNIPITLLSVVFVLLARVGIAFLIAHWARNRKVGRNTILIISFISPVIGIIVMLASGKKNNFF